MVLLQLLVAMLVGAAFLWQGPRAAAAATAGACTVALGSALLAVQAFGRLAGGATAFFRLLLGLLVKWVVVIGGLAVILFQYKLPPLAAMTGLVAASAVHLLAFRFKG